MLVRYLDSVSRTHDQTLLGWLLRELPRSHAIAVASGYFNAGILDWIEPELVALLGRGGQASFALGSNEGKTRREDLERLFLLLEPHVPARAALFVIHIPGGTYHPKAYFTSGPGHFSALVGSPNLTAASGTVNVEAALTLEADTLEPPLDTISAALDPLAFRGLANAYEIESVADLATLESMGAIGVPRPTPPIPVGPAAGAPGRATLRRARFPAATQIVGTPAPRARPPGAIHRPAAPAPAIVPPPAPAASIVIFVFSKNDLKVTGTREFSVPEAMRTWAASVLGGPLRPGQGDLLHANVLARLAAAPNTVIATPAPVRLWSAGASGGTHTDVRMVIGNYLRAELENLAILIHGRGLDRNDIGVIELPQDPTTEPIRLTIFLPGDPGYPALDALAVTVGGQQKRQAQVTTLPALPRWP